MARSKSQRQKKTKLNYIAKTKRVFQGRTFPNSDPKLNFLEVDEDLVSTFLRMKVGGDRLWAIEKEKIKTQEAE